MLSLLQRACLVAFVVTPITLTAQEPVPAPAPPADTARPADTAPAPRPVEPTADQQKYLRGLRTAARGVAQLKTGVDGVGRAESSKDTTRLKRAGRLLAGYCGTARTFLSQGRVGMSPTVYEDSARIKARRLTLQVDSLIKALPACATDAAKAPTRLAAGLLARLRNYETALLEFRSGVMAPQTPTQPTNQP
jgi:hypothetical protein